MTDLEKTRLCAEAMELDYDAEHGKVQYWPNEGRAWDGNIASEYRPLHDDAQAMALVKRFDLNLGPDVQNPGGEWIDGWEVSDYTGDEHKAFSPNLNRAIVECVAQMQAQRQGTPQEHVGAE